MCVCVCVCVWTGHQYRTKEFFLLPSVNDFPANPVNDFDGEQHPRRANQYSNIFHFKEKNKQALTGEHTLKGKKIKVRLLSIPPQRKGSCKKAVLLRSG